MSVLSLRLDTLPRDIDVDDEGLFSILSNFLQPTSAPSTSEAARAVIKLGLESEGQLSYFMSAFFEIAMHLARQTPHNHPSQDRLVDLIQALRSTPASDDGQSPWSSLLLHGSGEISEIYGGPTFPSESIFVQGRDATPTADEITGWLNLNSFLSRLWKSVGSVPDPEIQFEFYACVALRSALEGYSSFRGSARREEDRKADGALDCDVAVAAEWIDQAGPLIYAASFGQDGNGRESELVTAPGALYHGPEGLCGEHWEFWKKRFGELSTQDGVSEKSKSLALKAKLAMESIE